MKTIRTQQIVKAFILLKRRGVSTADRVYIAFKLKSITLDKQFERMMKKWKSKLNYYRAEKCQLKHIEQMLRGIATRDMTPL